MLQQKKLIKLFPLLKKLNIFRRHDITHYMSNKTLLAHLFSKTARN